MNKCLFQNGGFMRKIEILAPAGSYEAMQAAVTAGCDAVYMGGTKFGARAFADNPDTEYLLRAIDYVHLHGKRLYLTVNTLLKQNELEAELYGYLLSYYKEGLDAVIVQDVGVMRFIHAHFPKLPIHVSTQMTVTQASAAKLWRDCGVTRVVPARELGLTEIKEMSALTNLELEVFVHGALCYCYSGQCLMSSLIGGRSGNRGRCAQPCRLEYTVFDGAKKQKTYMLSPKDLCTLENIPELIQAGVHSFKIEGRMKRPEYTAGVVEVYRYFTDKYEELGAKQYEAWLQKHPELLKDAKLQLADLYNRGGFTSGYFKQHNGKSMMSMERPNHSGVLVGMVEKVTGNTAQIRVKEALSAQDILEIRMATGQNYEFTLKNPAKKNELLQANFKTGLSVRPKDAVYRTKNTALLTRLEENYLKQEKKIPVTGYFYAKEGEICSLTLQTEAGEGMPLQPFGEQRKVPVSVTVEGFIVQSAQKQPATEDAVKRPLLKTNETAFVFQELSVQLEGNVFLPNGQLNELRRTALAALEQEIYKQYAREENQECDRMFGFVEDEQIQKTDRRDAVETARQTSVTETVENTYSNGEDVFVEKEKLDGQEGSRKLPALVCQIVCQIEELEQLTPVLACKEVSAVYVNGQDFSVEEHTKIIDRVHTAGKQAVLVMPHIFRSTVQKKYEVMWTVLEQYDGYLIRAAEELVFLQEFGIKEYVYRESSLNILKGKKIILNYNMYVMNEEAKQYYKERGITNFTAPVELNAKEWEMLGLQDMEVVVYGRLPLMVSAQCIRKNIAQCKLVGNQTEKSFTLTDRMGKEYQTRQSCVPCYNTIYNPECLSLLSELKNIVQMGAETIRLDFTFETKDEVQAVLKEAVGVLYNGADATKTGYTKGHYKRGVQ